MTNLNQQLRYSILPYNIYEELLIGRPPLVTNVMPVEIVQLNTPFSKTILPIK